MGKPKVSIIVPVYNVSKYLKKCLDSVINQTLKDIEIIVVNDCSPDPLDDEICKEYVKKDNRIKYIKHKKNLGPGGARNTGIKNAKGKYIQFVDSDDQLELNAIKTLYTKAEENNLDMVMFNMRPQLLTATSKDFYNELKIYYHRSREYSDVLSGPEMFSKMTKNKDYLPSPTIYMLKLSFLKKNKLCFYEGIIHEDNLFTIKVLLLADRVSHINKELYTRNIRNNSIMTQRVGIEKIEGYFVCIKEILEFINQLNLDYDTLELLSYSVLGGLHSSLIKHLELISRKAVSDYLLSLNNDDFLLFKLLTSPRIIKNSNEAIKDNRLILQNNKYNKYALLVGKIILFLPYKAVRLLRKYLKK
jgi:glycosyltransferase involved in cell wall biosynthesis